MQNLQNHVLTIIQPCISAAVKLGVMGCNEGGIWNVWPQYANCHVLHDSLGASS